MTYISVDDVYSYAVFNLTSTAVSSATVAQYVIDSESLINGKLSKLYSVPFTSTGIPPLIARIERDLTGYYVLEYLYQQQNRNLNPHVEEKYKMALDLLDQIYDDKLRLVGSLSTGGVGEITPRSTVSMDATYTDTPYAVNMDSMWNWRIPDDLQDNIESNREGHDTNG